MTPRPNFAEAALGRSQTAFEHSIGGVSPLPPTGTLRQAYLHAGHMVVSRDPCRVTTVLGSCVAVGVWDPSSGVGGVNHFLLPRGNDPESARFGDVAVRTLIREVVAAGGRRRLLQAKLFGGACVLRAFKGPGQGTHLGQKNVEVARQILVDEGIPVTAEDVEGDRGRKLIFQTHDGAAWVRSL